jgi:hypothetical protein
MCGRLNTSRLLDRGVLELTRAPSLSSQEVSHSGAAEIPFTAPGGGLLPMRKSGGLHGFPFGADIPFPSDVIRVALAESHVEGSYCIGQLMKYYFSFAQIF